ncbi:MAG: hypothetical protein EPO06_00990 [Burkholderiaceae bacterium]|nr:MAG: hypothetical protein EPO06_00990 [Burkholderiaceae bacterium]
MSQQLNLFNPQLARRHDLLTARTTGLLLVVVAALALIGSVVLQVTNVEINREKNVLTDQAQEMQTQLTTLTQKISQYRPAAALEMERLALEQRLRGRQDVEQALAQGQLGRAEGFSEHLRAFAQLANARVWLTGVHINATGLLEIRGGAREAGQIPAYIGHLSKAPVFQGRSFSELALKAVSAAPATTPAEHTSTPADYIEFDLISAAATPGGAKENANTSANANANANKGTP